MASRSQQTPADPVKPKTRVELHILKGFVDIAAPRVSLGGGEVFQEGQFPPQAMQWVRGGLAKWVEVEA